MSISGFETIEESPIESILENPQKNFPRFLFESDVLSTIELLGELILHSAEGHHVAIECLWTWQDYVEAPHSLSPIACELQQTDCDKVAAESLRLFSRILKFAPNPVARLRIRHELNELRIHDIVEGVRGKFNWSDEIQDVIREWDATVDEAVKAPQEEASGNSCSLAFIHSSCETGSGSSVIGQPDTDSGTFSSEEEDLVGMEGGGGATMMTSKSEDRAVTADDVLAALGQFAKLTVPLDGLKLVAEILNCCIALFKRKKHTATFEELCYKLKLIFGELGEGETSCEPMPPPPPPPPGLLQSTQQLKGGALSKSPIPPPPPPPPPCIATAHPLSGLTTSGKGAASNVFESARSRASTSACVEIPRALKPKAIPPEGRKLRHLQWTKVPIDSALRNNTTEKGEAGRGSVWQRMDRVDNELEGRLDFAQLDACFSTAVAATIDNPSASTPGSGGFPSPGGGMNKQPSVSLVSSKRSLGVNIFLKMDKDSDRPLVENLREGAYSLIGVERLKMLLQLLPSDEEQKTLKNYSGDRDLLGQAEKFLLEVLSIPHYKWRIEAMAFKLEFCVVMSDSGKDLNVLLSAGREIMASRCLQKVLYCILHMGNYLNHGATAGNAVGFKLNSLWKLSEVRGTKSNRTLLHLLAEQLNNCWEELEDELPSIRDAARLSFENLRADVLHLQERLKSLEAASRNITNDAFFSEFTIFIEKTAKRDLATNTSLLADITSARRSLAVYFCESEKTFSLEEALKIISTTVDQFKAASNENIQQATAKRLEVQKATELQLPVPNGWAPKQPSQQTEQCSQLGNFLLNGPSTGAARRPRHSIHQTGGSLLLTVTGDQSQDRQYKTRRSSLFQPGQENERERTSTSSSLLQVGEWGADVGARRRRRSSQQCGGAGGGTGDDMDKVSLESFVDSALDLRDVLQKPQSRKVSLASESSAVAQIVRSECMGEASPPLTSSPMVPKSKTSMALLTVNSPSPTTSTSSPTATLPSSATNGESSAKHPPSPPTTGATGADLSGGQLLSTTRLTRKNSIYRVRAKQHSVAQPGLEKSKAVENSDQAHPVTNVKPSDIRASEKLMRDSKQLKSPSTTPSPNSASTKKHTFLSSSFSTKTPDNRRKGTSPSATTTSTHPTLPGASNPPAYSSRIGKSASFIHPSSSSTTANSTRSPALAKSPHCTTPTTTNNNGANGIKAGAATRKSAPPLVSAERRQRTIRSDSISTASRPALIKTGSVERGPAVKRWI